MVKITKQTVYELEIEGDVYQLNEGQAAELYASLKEELFPVETGFATGAVIRGNENETRNN